MRLRLISSRMTCTRRVFPSPRCLMLQIGFLQFGTGMFWPTTHSFILFSTLVFVPFIHSLIYLFIAVTRAAQLGPVGRSPGARADISNERTLLLILSAPPPAPYDSGINCSHRLPRDTGRCRGRVCQPASPASPADCRSVLLQLSPAAAQPSGGPAVFLGAREP